MTTNAEILFTEIPAKEGYLGVITLNRPQALNALTDGMCLALHRKLDEWKSNKNIHAVIIRGSGDRAFCAGGDIRKMYDNKHLGHKHLHHFFKDEYLLNYTLFHFPKPYISLLHGITMGGGAGVSVHGSHRIASDKFLFAMPETGIGFFPDIGASFFLSRAPGEIGTYLGLSGARIDAADALYAEFINFFIPTKQFDEVIHTLSTTSFAGDTKKLVSRLLQPFHISPGESSLQEHRVEIDRCFSGDTVEEIINHLEDSPHAWSKEVLKTLLTKSPTSLKVTLKELRLAKKLSFDACLSMEYTLAQHFLQHHDFYEGVRAALIDKDQKPRWDPATLEKISDTMLESYFKEKDKLFLT